MIRIALNLDCAMKITVAKVAYDRGSLPDGGSVDGTPIYHVKESFLDEQADQCIQVVDLSWDRKIAFYLDDILNPNECRKFIEITETLGFDPAAPGIQTPPGMRQNQTVHWIANAQDMQNIYNRIEPLLPPTIDNRRLAGELSQRINTYRYISGEQFRPHLDGDWPAFGLDKTGTYMEVRPSGRSMLSMILYLNGQEDGIEGGDTLLLEGQTVKHRVTPKAGRALFFRHGIHAESVLHAGDIVRGNTPKYVARINVMYEQ
jgi:hypothetical protein